MADNVHLNEERKKKLEALKEEGIDPYPVNFSIANRKHDILPLLNEFDSLSAGEDSAKEVFVAGRIMLKRIMGKVAFLTIKDAGNSIQIFISKKLCADFSILNNLDLGDFIGAKGIIFKTRKGEISVKAENLEFLSKSLRPLPDKHKGLKDIELRYRKRYLDLITNDDSYETLRKRSEILMAVRSFLMDKGYMEVETPMLHPLYGGASARPFITYYNSLKKDFYLRISPELYLKRLLVGGYGKVFDINKNFRNEGIDTTHNPEFTMLEVYELYKDYTDMMVLMESLYEYVALIVLGTTKISFKGQEIDVKAPWTRITMLDSIKKYVGVDADNMSLKDLRSFAQDRKLDISSNASWGDCVLAIFEELVEDKFVNPTFVIDHPIESTALCKVSKNDPRLVERFEPFSMGMELGNAFSELNDPVLQRKLFELQAKKLASGDKEATPLDEDYLEALEYGMPPAGGLGVGIDRMVMLLLGKDSIRDIILFPALKE